MYVPPKRIQFKSSDDIKEFKNRINQFKHDSRQHFHLQANLYQPMLKELLIYLTTQYGAAASIYRKMFLLDPSQVKLAFTDNFKNIDPSSFQFAETSALTGYITFSTTAIENNLIDSTESGYEKEQPFIKKWCKKNKEEILFWILIHEFTHLFDGYNNDRHDELFFEQVEKIAEEQKFLFNLDQYTKI